MYKTLQKEYYWPGLSAMCYASVRSCIACAKERVRKTSSVRDEVVSGNCAAGRRGDGCPRGVDYDAASAADEAASANDVSTNQVTAAPKSTQPEGSADDSDGEDAEREDLREFVVDKVGNHCQAKGRSANHWEVLVN